MPVLDLHGGEAKSRLKAAIVAAIEHDRSETIVLACAGMANMARDLTVELGLPVIDGVQAGTRLVEALAGLGIGTSKINSFAAPRPKEYRGRFADKAPT